MIEPSQLSIQNIDELCQHYLTILYQGVQRKTVAIETASETYGEILYPSVDKLLAAIKLTEHDSFVDYGSGLGKIVIQAFLKSPVKQAYGIEILPDLHQYAMNSAQRLQRELPQFYQEERKLTFLQGSFLELLLNDVTVALVNSTCFTQQLVANLGKLIDNTLSIHTLISLRPIPNLRRLRFKKAIRIQCSWDSALAYLYAQEEVV